MRATVGSKNNDIVKENPLHTKKRFTVDGKMKKKTSNDRIDKRSSFPMVNRLSLFCFAIKHKRRLLTKNYFIVYQ